LRAFCTHFVYRLAGLCRYGFRRGEPGAGGGWTGWSALRRFSLPICSCNQRCLEPPHYEEFFTFTLLCLRQAAFCSDSLALSSTSSLVKPDVWEHESTSGLPHSRRSEHRFLPASKGQAGQQVSSAAAIRICRPDQERYPLEGVRPVVISEDLNREKHLFDLRPS